jgi:predicted acylesterase/phospholipase RssA
MLDVCGWCAEATHPRGEQMDNAIGLVMTGGGARGAYQAGILKRMG